MVLGRERESSQVEVSQARDARRTQEIGQATPFNASRNPLHHLGVGDTNDQDS